MEKIKLDKKVLIIEDEKIINDYMSTILKEEVAYIDSCYSGYEAIEKIKSNHYDLILCDVIMENGSGLDVLDFLNLENKKILVVMVSALGQKTDILKAYEKGAIDFITKPIDEDILISKVKSLLMYIKEGNSVINFDNNLKEVFLESVNINLTRTEYEILYLLYINSPIVFSKEELNDKIWFNNKGMSNKIIEVNIFNIRKKLGNYSKFLKTKRQVGYYFEDKN